MHSEETEFQHKAVFIAEYEGVRGADFPIRTFQSEQKIQWEFVDNSAKDGLKTKRKAVLGPAAFIQATTRVSLHPENETRLLFVHVDESPEQTQAINLRQGQAAAGKVEPCPASVFVSWHEFFLGLTENRITIPFAEQLSESMPAQRIRSRRDFPKLLALIEASAYLHQASRPRNPKGLILAVPDDYQIARVLFASCYDTALEKSTGEFLTAVKHESEGFKFSVEEMMQKTGWKKTKAYEVLKRLEDAGIVIPAEPRGAYVLARRMPEPKLTLPEKLRLTADNFRISVKTPLQAPTSEMTTPRGCLDGKTENGAATSVETAQEGQQGQQASIHAGSDYFLEGQQQPPVAEAKSTFTLANTRGVADVAPLAPQNGKGTFASLIPCLLHPSDYWSIKDDGSWHCRMCEPP